MTTETETTNVSTGPETIEFNNKYSNVEGVTYSPNAKVEIKLTCENLPNKPNAKIYVFFEEKVYTSGIPESKWILVGNTETANNCANPNFAKSFIFEYYFQYLSIFFFFFLFYFHLFIYLLICLFVCLLTCIK